MPEHIDDIIAGYTGKTQTPGKVLKERDDGRRVITDPNTILLQQIVYELQCMRHEMEVLRREIRPHWAQMGNGDIRRILDEYMYGPSRSQQYKGLQDLVNKTNLQVLQDKIAPAKFWGSTT